MARPPASEMVRFGLTQPFAPGANTSTARPPSGKNAETKSCPFLSNATPPSHWVSGSTRFPSTNRIFPNRAAQAGVFVSDKDECTRRFVGAGEMFILIDIDAVCDNGGGRGLRCARRRNGVPYRTILRAGARCKRHGYADGSNVIGWFHLRCPFK